MYLWDISVLSLEIWQTLFTERSAQETDTWRDRVAKDLQKQVCAAR